MARSHDGCRPFTVGVPPHGEYGARRSAAFLGRAAARWAARAPLGSGAAPRYRRAGLLRDHWPKPHSGNDARRCGGSATRRRAVDERARAPACYPTSAHGALRIAHTHMHTHTHTCTCACACACACAHAHAHACACACACARVASSEGRASAGAPEGERGLTAASQVALVCGHRSGHGCSQGHS